MQQLEARWQKAMKALAILLIWVGLISCSFKLATASASDDNIKFLTSNSEGFSANAALVHGKLKLVDQCFRIEDEAGNGYTVVWPKAVSHRKSGDTIELVYKGKVFAQVGETVEFGGGTDSFTDDDEMKKYINGPSGCPQPFWFL